ncbi:MAG TPA: hypothetical protein VFT20_08565 [Candidatus Limnocylindrales bacterium]|nr:hypothetical protein [Candidatus Limnocylindrales bacterium]
MPTDWGESIFLAISTALNDLIAAIPAIIGALLILLVGWILSGILARIVQTVLARAGADRLFAEHGGSVYGERAATVRPSIVGGELVKWLIRIVFLVAAANVLNLPAVSELLNQVLLWIPNLIVAAIVLLVAPLIARFVRGVIEVGAGRMGFTNASLLGRIAEAAIVVFAVIIAIDQIGIAADLVNTLFMGVVAALALAIGLAFGLGGRDVAADLTRKWYESSQRTAERVAAVAQQDEEMPPARAARPGPSVPRTTTIDPTRTTDPASST